MSPFLDWIVHVRAKAHVTAIAEFKKNDGDRVISGARFVRLWFN
jgi:hypothetical protein